MDPQLYNAVRSGDKSLIRQLQSSDETILLKATPETGTVLHVAARFRKTEIAKLLLEWDPSLKRQKNSKWDTPLHIAARIGDSDMVRLLVNHEVAEFDQVVEEAYEMLVRIVNIKGETALHDAVRGGHLEVVKLLIEKDPLLATLTTGGGESPLFLAVDRKHIQVAEHILNHAPSCSFQGRNNMNALHAAIIRGCNLDFIQELLGKSPSAISEVDNSGWTALHYASRLDEQPIISEELLSTDKSNSIAYVRDEEGMTALHVAATNLEVDVMQLLAQKCPDIWDLVDNKGHTALHVATKFGRANIVKFILKEAPDDIINQQDKEGNSCLHLAVLGGKLKIVELLVNDGRVDKTAINNEGVTFGDIKLSMGDPEPPLKVIRDACSLEATTKRRKQEMLSVNEVGQRKNNIPTVKDNEDDKKEKKAKELEDTNVVVATLIAGVSFTAAVTMPGGYKSDGHDAGMAILVHEASFKAFVVANSLAFAFSFGSLLSHFLVSLPRGRVVWRFYSIRLQIICSIFCLLVAFMAGSYAVLVDSRELSISSVVVTLFYFYAMVGVSGFRFSLLSSAAVLYKATGLDALGRRIRERGASSRSSN